MGDVLSLLGWLEGPGRRLTETQAFIEALGDQLVEFGLPIDRITSAIPILHPQVRSSQILWEPTRLARERLWQLNDQNRHVYENSPLFLVYGGNGPVRVKITPAPEPSEFDIITELRADGFTDYAALPAPFSDGTIKAMTFATRRTDGFADADIAALMALMPQISLLLEIQTLRRTTRTLLDTYVGPTSGRRILDGQIRRGQGEDIRAVLWFSDLRGFTEHSDALSNEDLIVLLNDYFGALVAAVEAERGEVLKFIGDAMLAIFPIATASSGKRAAQRALAAARTAQKGIADINGQRRLAGKAEIRWGLALHVGEVHYGNIGGEGRLDFTVIGAAVNLAARLQGLSANLGESCVVSDDFAALLKGAGNLRDLGGHELKGVTQKRQVFGV